MTSKLRVGIDFDNTIIGYDEVFSAAARRTGLIGSDFVGCKRAVRDAIRHLPDGELAWQRLQGQVYGKEIFGAQIMAGVAGFLRHCRAKGCEVAVVSHKTEYGHYDSNRVNLREAARDWMAAHGLFNDVIQSSNVYFENTREDKVRRIAALSLTYFIDDLEEVLTDPAFPREVKRILFAKVEQPATAPYVVCSTWLDIDRCIFGGPGH